MKFYISRLLACIYMLNQLKHWFLCICGLWIQNGNRQQFCLTRFLYPEILCSAEEFSDKHGVCNLYLISMLIIRPIKRRIYLFSQGSDIVVRLNGNFSSELCDSMQNALKILYTWCEEVNISKNASKTEIILFTKRISIKYLQFIIDDILTWKPYVDTKIY